MLRGQQRRGATVSSAERRRSDKAAFARRTAQLMTVVMRSGRRSEDGRMMEQLSPAESLASSSSSSIAMITFYCCYCCCYPSTLDIIFQTLTTHNSSHIQHEPLPHVADWSTWLIDWSRLWIRKQLNTCTNWSRQIAVSDPWETALADLEMRRRIVANIRVS
jgi:hypothetical protein